MPSRRNLGFRPVQGVRWLDDIPVVVGHSAVIGRMHRFLLCVRTKIPSHCNSQTGLGYVPGFVLYMAADSGDYWTDDRGMALQRVRPNIFREVLGP